MRSSVLALWTISAVTLVGVAYVHWGQKVEREVRRRLGGRCQRSERLRLVRRPRRR
jgi:hypothetical protein